MVRGIVVRRSEAGVRASVEQVDDADLGEGDVTVDVEFSSLNYKDALALTGSPGVMRVTPLIPGIDLVGTVAEARDVAGLAPGDPIIVTGWGLGETRPGGLAERARVPADRIVAGPAGLPARRAAALGTAGLTAALAVAELESRGIGDGEVLVTAASGGVGSIAIALLAAAGRTVVAATGRESSHDYLRALGASGFVDRASLAEPGRPLQSQRWAGVIDSVGGTTLATALAQARYGATVAACGLVGGTDLPTTVMPFILRGVHLAGINSVEAPQADRVGAWARLAASVDGGLLDSITTVIGLDEALRAGPAMLDGSARGRTVVDVRR